MDAGATNAASCALLQISVRTVERWKIHPQITEGRAGPITPSRKNLTTEERKMIIDVSNLPLYRDLHPWLIVAKLADLGQYIASESSLYRVLKAANLLKHRSKNKPAKKKRPKDLLARALNQVWSGDITYLKSSVKELYYYSYLTMDIYSRFIVSAHVEEAESSDHAAKFITWACAEQNIDEDTLTLHSDNGGPMKGATMLATLQKLYVVPSFSRPAVSDDNPFSESLFKKSKYKPSYPDSAFANLEEAQTWVTKFVQWYNTEHMHSGIRFVTPKSRHENLDAKILKNRNRVYTKAKLENPIRWSGKTRNWSLIDEVKLNPGKEKKMNDEMLRKKAA